MTLKERLSQRGVDKKTARNLFATFVELTQNIVRYSAEREANNGVDEETAGVGLIVVGSEGGKYFAAAGNKVRNENVVALRDQLARLQEMDSGELKRQYRETLRGAPNPESKGASVGKLVLL